MITHMEFGSCICIYNNQSRKLSFSKTFFDREEFEKAALNLTVDGMHLKKEFSQLKR